MITPLLRKPQTDAEATSEEGAEARMRRALGKLGAATPGKPEATRRATYQAPPGAGRHRFRQDGEVPVVRLALGEGGRGGARPAYTPVVVAGSEPGQAQTGEERVQGGGEGARQVQELIDQLRATQTRLGHAELAASEATRTARARQEEAASLRLALDAAEATLAQVREELAASEQARERLEHRGQTPRRPGLKADNREGTGIRRKVGRPLGSTSRVRDQVPTGEPQPVKWWARD